MRIAVANPLPMIVGGVEVYLADLLPRLQQLGHSVSFWHEWPLVENGRAPIAPLDCATFDVSVLGVSGARASLEQWQPDVIFAHAFRNEAWIAVVQSVAPVLYFPHDYGGTCISGNKTFQWPVIESCERRLGWPCLIHYLPRRCGGHSPITMAQLFRDKRRRLGYLDGFAHVVTASAHMAMELRRHGVADTRLSVLPVPCKGVFRAKNVAAQRLGDTLHLLYVGRLESLKGVDLLIDTLPLLAVRQPRALRLTIVGDGNCRAELETRAAHIRDKGIEISFHGWLPPDAVAAAVLECHVVVLPSVWPEPHGQVGVQAMAAGKPVAAFNLGGMPEWLSDGVTGALADAHPPTAQKLADAIRWCAADDERHTALAQAARARAEHYSWSNHLRLLDDVLQQTSRVPVLKCGP